MWACLLFQDVHCPLTFLCAGDQLRPSGLLRARRQAASVAFDIMRASFPHSPILKELFRSGNHECYMQRQWIGMSDSDSNSDISPGVARYQDLRAIQVGLSTPLFYPFRDSHFLSCRQRQHLLCQAPLTAERSSMPPTTIQSRRPINRPPLRSVCTTSSNAMWRRCLQATPVCQTVCQTESTCFGTAEGSRQWSQGETT
jgi:hypothetical protein